MLTDHAKLLHQRTQGRIGSLTTLLERACYLAIHSGVEALTPEVLDAVTLDNAAELAHRAG